MCFEYNPGVLKELEKYFNAVHHSQRPIFNHLHPPAISSTCPFRSKKQSQWTISDFKLIRHLGGGGFGEIHLAEHRASNWKCALKFASKSELQKENDLAHLFQEVRIHMSLGYHPNIVSFYGCFDIPDKDFYIMVLEYIPGVELSEYIRHRSSISFHRVQQIFYQVVLAVDFVHGQNVIHRDVKSENFMINPDTNEVKLLDFGLSLMSHQSRRTVGGTYEFIAPEMQKAADSEGKYQYDSKIDNWSCGIILYELITGNVPWPELDGDYYPQFARSLNCSTVGISDIPNIDKCIPRDLRPILKKLLHTNPKKRISLREVLETSKLFASLDEDVNEDDCDEGKGEAQVQSQAAVPRSYSVMVRGTFSDWETQTPQEPRGPSRPSWHVRHDNTSRNSHGYNEYYFSKMNASQLDYRSLVFYYDPNPTNSKDVDEDETNLTEAQLLEIMSEQKRQKEQENHKNEDLINKTSQTPEMDQKTKPKNHTTSKRKKHKK